MAEETTGQRTVRNRIEVIFPDYNKKSAAQGTCAVGTCPPFLGFGYLLLKTERSNNFTPALHGTGVQSIYQTRISQPFSYSRPHNFSASASLTMRPVAGLI